MSWTVRDGGVEDAEAVLALWRRADAEVTDTDDMAAIRGLLDRDAAALLIADANREVVGSLIVGWDGWRGQLYRLAVDPAWRRQGIATALMRTAEDRLRAIGARRVAAIVLEEHDHAHGFWRSAGYDAAPQTRYVRSL